MKLLIIESLAIDSVSNDMVVVLRVEEDDDIIPIWIGNHEAISIALGLSNFEPPRPLTHDLIVNLITGLEADIERVVITAIQDNTYYALLYVQKDGDLIVVDLRPSDAIALAVRTGAPIFMKDEIPTISSDPNDEKRRKLEKKLRRINPEQLLGG
jgi:bifunctional DNase/RNase